MNRDRIKQLLPILEKFAEGKTIQRFNHGWVNYSENIPDGHLDLPHEWRVKPKPREFWIIREKTKIDNSGQWYSYRPSLSVHRTDEELIHVREVIE